MDWTIKQALRHPGASDPPLMSRAIGVLLLCGSALVLLQPVLARAPEAHSAGLYGVAAVAALLGGASVAFAGRARWWTVHAVFAAGTALVCLGLYFAGVATGAYSVLFVWLVVVAASSFSARATAAHVAWILVASGVALSMVGSSSGLPVLTRWAFGSLLLVVGATVMIQLVAGRRAIEEQLRLEIEEKTRLQRDLEHLAHHDPLTGLANRRRFEQELARELERAGRNGTSLCVIAIDIDALKAYNDAHGHAAGDHLLKSSASAWTGVLRGYDLMARMGGDEFVALLPDCTPAEAQRVLARLRRSMSNGRSCSGGVAQWNGLESAEELLSRADDAMYEQKTATTTQASAAAR